MNNNLNFDFLNYCITSEDSEVCTSHIFTFRNFNSVICSTLILLPVCLYCMEKHEHSAKLLLLVSMEVSYRNLGRHQNQIFICWLNNSFKYEIIGLIFSYSSNSNQAICTHFTFNDWTCFIMCLLFGYFPSLQHRDFT